MGMVMVKCPQPGHAGFLLVLGPIVRLSCGALCFMAIPIARSVGPITTGSPARPGSRSRSPGPCKYSVPRRCADVAIRKGCSKIFRRIVAKRTDGLTIRRLDVTPAGHHKLKLPIADPARTCLRIL